MEVNFTQIGKRIAKIRKTQHVSQMELTEMADCTIAERYFLYKMPQATKKSCVILTWVNMTKNISKIFSSETFCQ